MRRCWSESNVLTISVAKFGFLNWLFFNDENSIILLFCLLIPPVFSLQLCDNVILCKVES